MNDQQQAAMTANSWLDQEPLFLDTETTGLYAVDEIIDIAILNVAGKTLLDSLVKPTILIPFDATKIHGITTEMVGEAPTIAELWPEIERILADRLVIIYNSDFDVRMIMQSAHAHNIPVHINIQPRCAMNLFSAYYGDWNDYRQSYRWQSLSTAASYCGLPMPLDLHRARADADLCRKVLLYMANVEV